MGLSGVLEGNVEIWCLFEELRSWMVDVAFGRDSHDIGFGVTG